MDNQNEEIEKSWNDVFYEIGTTILKYIFKTLITGSLVYFLWDITVGTIFSLQNITFVQAIFLKMFVDFLKLD